MKLRMIFAGAAMGVAAFASVSIAQDDPIKTRQALMKEIGGQAKIVGEMLQGKRAFDATEAKAALMGIATNAEAYPNLFPEGSEQGDTEALPAIWANKSDFEAKSTKFAEDATVAANAADTAEDAFKAAAGAMFGNCKGCHEVYRKPS